MTTLNNPYGIKDPKHWTNAKPRKPSIYAQTLGKPILRDAIVNRLLNEYRSIKGETKYKNYLRNQLRSLGADDFTNGYDDGEPPKGADYITKED